MKTASAYAIPAGILLSLIFVEPAVAQHSGRAVQRVVFGVQTEHRAVAQATSPAGGALSGTQAVDAFVTVELHNRQSDKVTAAIESPGDSRSGFHLLMSENNGAIPSTARNISRSGSEQAIQQAQLGIRLVAAFPPKSGEPGTVVFTVTE